MVWLSSANTCDSLSKQTTVALFLSKNGDAEDEPNVQTYRENNDSEYHYDSNTTAGQLRWAPIDEDTVSFPKVLGLDVTTHTICTSTSRNTVVLCYRKHCILRTQLNDDIGFAPLRSASYFENGLVVIGKHM